MDGTLCDVSAIRQMLLDTRNFDAFHAESVNCPPHHGVVELLNQAKDDGHAIIVVTARKHRWRNHTATWLALNGVHSDAMFMRHDNDQRKDYLVKKDILNTVRNSYDVVHAVDDNPAVIKLWIEEGIPTTLVTGWIDLEKEEAKNARDKQQAL